MKKSEQILAIALGIILLLGACSFAFIKMTKWKKDIERREHDLALQKVTAEELLKQKDYWMARSDWLAAKQPVFTKAAEVNDELYNLVSKSLKEAGINASPPQQQPLDESNPGLKAPGVMVNASAEPEKLLRWLHKLQQTPDAFISVQSLSLKPDPEDLSKVNMTDIHIKKWYRVGDSAPKPQATESQ